MDVPVFAPTSAGPLAATAHIPEGGDVQGPCVLLLPGGQNPRSRDRMGLDMAREMATRGQPVLRVDLPGCGLSPTDEILQDRELLAGVLSEAIAWFRDLTHINHSAVAGTCGGAMLSLAVAKMDIATERAVAIDMPLLRRRGKKSRLRRVRAGIAAIDPVGERMTSRLVASGGDDKGHIEWMPGVLEDLAAAAEAAQVTLIYGGEDHFFDDFNTATASDGFPPNLRDKLRIEVLEGAQLYGFTKIKDLEWLQATMIRQLSHLPLSGTDG